MGATYSTVASSKKDDNLINTSYTEVNKGKYYAKQRASNLKHKEKITSNTIKTASNTNNSTAEYENYTSNTKDYIILTYSRLINMGFDETLSLKAANKYSKNINKAINYVQTHEKTHPINDRKESTPLLETIEENTSNTSTQLINSKIINDKPDIEGDLDTALPQPKQIQLTNDIKVKAIMAMGYDEIVATIALQVANDDLPEAIKLISKAKSEVSQSKTHKRIFDLQLNESIPIDESNHSNILSLVNRRKISSELVRKQLLESAENDIYGAISPIDETTMTHDDIKQHLDIDSTWKPIRQRNNNRFHAYVGIDFGTDGTGFAYAFPSGKIIWQQNHTKHATLKERTNILLEAEPPHNVIKFGIAATEMYMRQTDKSCLYFDGFKMALYDKDLIVNRHNDSMCNNKGKINYKNRKQYFLRAANGIEIEARIVFEKALEEIKKIAMKTLNTFEIRQVMKVQWILTVPAIWSNYAKEIMKEAAEKAGIKKRGIIDHLLIATEPECASIIARKHINNLSVIGTKYIMLDLGGGTADIACHKTTGNNQFQQIYAPDGGKWGSIYIDIEYHKLLDDIFGEEIMNNFKMKESNKWIDIKEKFRKSKHRYDGRDEMNIDLNNSFIKFIESNHVGNDIENIINEYKYKGEIGLVECDDGVLTVDKVVWIDLFKCVVEPIINKTFELLKRKEMKGCKDILLSGGLSENKYLRLMLQESFGDNYNIHIVPRPILAVVEGAAMMGLKPNSIATWYAKESIGLQVTREYDSKIDDEKMKRYDYVSTKEVIDCGFSSLIKKGTPINPNEFIIKWFRPWKLKQQNKIIIKLYSSENINELYTIEPCICEGEWTIELESNWGNKKFPVVYWDKGSEKRLYIAHPEWKDEDREIKVKWRSPFD